MSNLTLKAAFKEDKFNLKTVSVLFILVDLFLAGSIELIFFFYLVLYQISLILALMFGLRGQGKYKTMMLSLQSIARNRDLTTDEREARLVNGIHHHCLELGYIYEERNKSYGLFTHKKRNLPTPGTGKKKDPGTKKTKNLEVKKTMSKLIIDEVVWKQLGYMLVGLWGLFGLVLAYILDIFLFHWILIIFITGAWEIVNVFILFYLHYIFNLEPITDSPALDVKGFDRAKEIEIELAGLDPGDPKYVAP